MGRGRRKLAALAALLAAFVVLWRPVAVGGKNGAAGRAVELPPIVIGISNVQSGPSQFLGQRLVQGSMAYFQMVNENGGVHGRKIYILLKDDRYEPNPAIQNTNDLIEKDKVFFLFDYVGTPTLTRVLPLLRYYEREKIVNVAPFTGADPQRKPPYDKFVFNIRASYREETRALVRYLHAKGYRRIGFLGQADAYGKSGEVGVTEALTEFGLHIVESVTYRRNESFETDMSAQVKILREAGADAVIAVGVYGPCGAFIRDARMTGWNVPVANVSFVGAAEMLARLGETSQKVGRDLTTNLINSQVVPSPEDLRLPLVAEFRAHIQTGHHGFITLEGWLNAVVATEALRRAGPNATREDFIRAMESLHDWDPGLGVRLEFSPSSHQGLHKVWLTRTEQGRWVPEESSQEAR
ncbi:MAG TPA: ABC transporter substrate-binding protein [Candidatus Dormibacteraeota bacterium]|nr:ABC transporter substrate-binding protein [Candidatus Dormibacteraeota bacterium]